MRIIGTFSVTMALPEGGVGGTRFTIDCRESASVQTLLSSKGMLHFTNAFQMRRSFPTVHIQPGARFLIKSE
jgi:hypothetical protein